MLLLIEQYAFAHRTVCFCSLYGMLFCVLFVVLLCVRSRSKSFIQWLFAEGYSNMQAHRTVCFAVRTVCFYAIFAISLFLFCSCFCPVSWVRQYKSAVFCPCFVLLLSHKKRLFLLAFCSTFVPLWSGLQVSYRSTFLPQELEKSAR